jgi:hypothetical protein
MSVSNELQLTSPLEAAHQSSENNQINSMSKPVTLNALACILDTIIDANEIIRLSKVFFFVLLFRTGTTVLSVSNVKLEDVILKNQNGKISVTFNLVSRDRQTEYLFTDNASDTSSDYDVCRLTVKYLTQLLDVEISPLTWFEVISSRRSLFLFPQMGNMGWSRLFKKHNQLALPGLNLDLNGVAMSAASNLVLNFMGSAAGDDEIIQAGVMGGLYTRPEYLMAILRNIQSLLRCPSATDACRTSVNGFYDMDFPESKCKIAFKDCLKRFGIKSKTRDL